MVKIPRRWVDPNTGKVYDSHAKWLDEHLPKLLAELGVDERHQGIVSTHGDKCFIEIYAWAERGILYPHGAAIFLMSYFAPWKHEIRDASGQADTAELLEWTYKKYDELKDRLPKLVPLC